MLIADNPFYILGASLKDNREKILELAEEKSLFEDENKCFSASSDIINPKNRLDAELSWIVGGFDFSEIRTIYQDLLISNDVLCSISVLENLDSLSKANLIISLILEKGGELASDKLAEWILEVADYYEKISYEYLFDELNVLRNLSGFPLVSDLEMVADGVQLRGRYFKNAIIEVLDKFPSLEIVGCMTVVADSATNYGSAHPPRLIHDLINSYEVEAQEFLDAEMDNAITLIDEIAVNSNDIDNYDLSARVEKLVEVIHNWDSVAQPIQVISKSRGVRHKISYDLFGKARGLAITLFNEHNQLSAAKKITNALKSAFEELDVAVEKTSEDLSALNDIEESRRFEGLVDDFHGLSKSIFEQIDKNPLTAKTSSEEFVVKSQKTIDELVRQKAGQEIIKSISDDISFVLVQCAIVYGNKTSKWKDCINILNQAKSYAVGQKAKEDVRKNLTIASNNAILYEGVEPINSAPTLSSINGVGFTLYGSSDHDQGSGSYISTYYFILIGIPLFPIARYRVIPFDRGYRFLGKVPLRTFDKLHIAAFIGAMLWIFF